MPLRERWRASEQCRDATITDFAFSFLISFTFHYHRLFKGKREEEKRAKRAMAGVKRGARDSAAMRRGTLRRCV